MEDTNSKRSDFESVANLLAVILHGDRRNRRQLALRLLGHFGSLRGLLNAPVDELTAVGGIGTGSAAILGALPEIAQRYFAETLPEGHRIQSPADTEHFLRAKIGHLGHELFCCIYLDNRHRVLRFDELFRGTIDGTSVYPREVVKESLAVNAAAVIIAHNHPSGVAEPSQADERITRRIRAALELVDIRLLDHLIIGAGSATSLASRGLL